MKILIVDQNSGNKKELLMSNSQLRGNKCNYNPPNKTDYIHEIRKLDKNTEPGSFTIFIGKLY